MAVQLKQLANDLPSFAQVPDRPQRHRLHQCIANASRFMRPDDDLAPSRLGG
jgi:hypothetical protein